MRSQCRLDRWYVLAGMSAAGLYLVLPESPTVHARHEVDHALTLQTVVIVAVIAAIGVRISKFTPWPTMVVWTVACVTIVAINRFRIFNLVRLIGSASATENQCQLTAMVENSNEIIGLANADGTIRYASPSVETVTGVPPEQWCGERFDRILPRLISGVDDFLGQVICLGPGERADWQGEIRPVHSDTPKTVKLWSSTTSTPPKSTAG